MRPPGATTSEALLGLLSIQPMSGYDIRQLVPWSIGHFWNESYGQIYPALQKLARQGLLAKKTERRRGARERNVYALTPAGRARLAEWLKSAAGQPPPPRNELLLRVFFGANAAPEITRSQLQAAVERQTIAVRTFENTREQLLREEKNSPQLPYWLMTVNCGLHSSRATLRWAKESIALLDSLPTARLKKRKGASR